MVEAAEVVVGQGVASLAAVTEAVEPAAVALMEARVVAVAVRAAHRQVPRAVWQAAELMAAEQMALATKEGAGWAVAGAGEEARVVAVVALAAGAERAAAGAESAAGQWG